MHFPLRTQTGSAKTPILCLAVAVGAAGATLFYSQREIAALRAELTALREQARQSEAQSITPKEVEKLRAQAREAELLKKETEELPRLRGEVTLLRKDKAVFEQARAENAQLREQAQLAQRLQTENNALRGQNQVLSQAQMQALGIGPYAGAQADQANKNGCIANLKQIDGAVQQWALEHKKQAGDPYTLRDPALLAYLKGSVLPLCPSGGRYREGFRVSQVPLCSVPGHTL